MKVGEFVKGKISKIVRYGAFVDIEGGEKGFIHISKISKDYVKRIEDYLKEGQEISAKVIGRARNGGWELSLKDTPEDKETGDRKSERKDMDFERKLSRFLKESSQKFSEYRRRLEKKGRRSSW
ncbi:S1 RNA-binding domain-containing protein [Thermotoga sp.]|uniref:S1 RNA-binding domain-containing protein n=1 Tax=Thermotoga sp. TaxID=28240 RepID=UPI0025E23A0E|nr:S1 RNA-binding domain-containing protein [Thermotoga sp.]MCD6552108.1 S1 RNA-binding domain-containing protein [Thermotoga sp.]